VQRDATLLGAAQLHVSSTISAQGYNLTLMILPMLNPGAAALFLPRIHLPA
jgi:hypothetical protein